jgi:hypothetical protein
MSKQCLAYFLTPQNANYFESLVTFDMFLLELKAFHLLSLTANKQNNIITHLQLSYAEKANINQILAEKSTN